MAKPNNSGFLVISLDFELLWGVFDKVDWRNKIEYFENTKRIIPEILQLFEKYDIACTWATVGMLFNSCWEEWNNNKPQKLPDYTNSSLSPYQFGNDNQNEKTEKLCFSPELIREILKIPGQELATHTYSHYYCREEGQNAEMFDWDLKKAKELANSFNTELRSIVFPRNQFNQEYVEICLKNNISNFRINPTSWYWKSTEEDSISKKIFRTGDAYLGPTDKSYDPENALVTGGSYSFQMSSRLLRPVSKHKFLENLKIKRIKTEITKAAKNNEVYHLWWHPHNFGDNPRESLEQLESILIHFKECRSKYNMISTNMEGLRAEIL